MTTTNPGSYRFNHTMIRIKDAAASLKFYQDVMGMTRIRTSENPDNKFNLYFLGYPRSASPPTQAHREGLLELTWNYGTEKDPNFKYHNGNKDPQGFGHICVSVDDLDKACSTFEEKGVRWQKRLTDGRMKNVAFVLDPDDYWVEVIQNEVRIFPYLMAQHSANANGECRKSRADGSSRELLKLQRPNL